MKFTAAAVQIAPVKADYAANIERVAEAAVRCSADGADLAVFPETVLSGYFLQGGVAEVAVTAEQAKADLAERLTGKIERPLDVVVGFYERHDGHIYNCAAHISFSPSDAEILHVHRKFFLPTYGVFDEERFVARGRDISAYSTRFGRFAMLICEDTWHSVTATIAALKGAQTIVAVAASPARGFSGESFANLDHYRRLLRAISEEHGLWTINAMLVGFEGGKGFTGGSVIVDPFGKIVVEGPATEEFILSAEIDLAEVARAREKFPMLADLVSVLEDVAREMQEVNEAECPQP
ncbi:MAG: beta-ureidopropionase [Armatimonadetes bacterium]|nr:beta-ureidopropionase [Armatimonadota bacterium]